VVGQSRCARQQAPSLVVARSRCPGGSTIVLGPCVASDTHERLPILNRHLQLYQACVAVCRSPIAMIIAGGTLRSMHSKSSRYRHKMGPYRLLHACCSHQSVQQVDCHCISDALNPQVGQRMGCASRSRATHPRSPTHGIHLAAASFATLLGCRITHSRLHWC
jgi:hypothetical protein